MELSRKSCKKLLTLATGLSSITSLLEECKFCGSFQKLHKSEYFSKPSLSILLLDFSNVRSVQYSIDC